jgi:CRP/FNR family transcriptional regulator, cyclic AMP receptor protein
VTSLATSMRSVVLSAPEVTRLSSLRRSTSLFSQDQAADSVYFIDEGLVKLTRVNHRGDRIILTIRGPQELVGEEALTETRPTYYTEAEVLTAAAIFRIPRGLLNRALLSSPELTTGLVAYLLERRLALAEKVELLCLHDVEYRILHYLAELAALVTPLENGDGFQIPITQLELADLIGATRETTSTTLNQLERRGLVKLSRRMLTVPSPPAVRGAAMAKAEHESVATGSA